MHLPSPSPALLALGLLLGLALVLARPRAGARRGRRGRAFVEVNPRYRPLFRRLGLTEAGHFLALEAEVVSGHPDRHVSRFTLWAGPGALIYCLKHELCVHRSVSNACA